MKKRFHVSGTITYSFIGHVDVDTDTDDDLYVVARRSARDYLHDGLFQGSYDIQEDDIHVDPNAEEIEWVATPPAKETERTTTHVFTRGRPPVDSEGR